MVLTLASVLNVPLRDQNELLVAAGFDARFPEPPSFAPEIDAAIAQMMRQHEPYPLTVLSCGDFALRGLMAEPTAEPADMYTLHFDPRRLRPFVANWEALALGMLSRLHRDSLHRRDERLEQVTRFPDVPASWKQPDFSTDDSPTLNVRYARGALRVGFLVMVTTFLAPKHLSLDGR